MCVCSKHVNGCMMDKPYTNTDCEMSALLQPNHNTATTPWQAYLRRRQESAHLLVSPRQQHTGVLAKSLISIFYEGTQRQTLEYLPCKSTAYYINYSVDK